MKLEVNIELNLKIKEVTDIVLKASRLGLRDGIVLIANDAINNSPWKTGNNRRSLFFGVTGFGHTQALLGGRESKDTWTGVDESLLDESKIEAVLYSTSGYGGFLETGTYKMGARPYIRPAYDKNKDKLPLLIKEYIE